ncbi:uncharacterized protein BJ171DRAFT_489770 [Polychytrium aggregatum]|uniref:uncharacterized protein n=1 Tax=Polychytrium aggregatum TaxID=110093 RepID=UPI0022FEAA7C|nr:uncharacterized protein BJ171DRAFT_489770 [Polychytrium aggregatum]KAI9208726.1 hypothetical protein BJ171DRAFT_489770 [Polychytrium aggregatum]
MKAISTLIQISFGVSLMYVMGATLFLGLHSQLPIETYVMPQILKRFSFIEPSKLPIACVAFFGFLTYVVMGVAAVVAQTVSQKGYNASSPRIGRQNVRGFALRFLSAHENSLEAFPVFAAAVAFAYITNVSPEIQQTYAVYFVLVRVLYNWAYILGIGPLRSLCYLQGMFACYVLFANAVNPDFNLGYQVRMVTGILAIANLSVSTFNGA